MDYYERQSRTPLYDAVVRYAKKKKVSFHTPGHKHGTGIDKKFREFVGSRIFDIDLTLLEEVDSLHDPRGVIKEAQRLASEAYGSDYSFFLVNGTSCGNHAMILATCMPGDKIVIPRNAHKSVIAGVILSGAEPIYLQPEINKELNIICNITPEQVSKALGENPDAKAVLITSPTYNGIVADIKKIAEIVHSYKKILLVDEAHGPHLKFHPDLPISAIEAGADIIVQSTHKIISGLTQASMLHARKTVDILKLKRILQLIQTTSPSYILMSALDVARMQMALYGKNMLSHAIDLANTARIKINQMKLISCFGKEMINQNSIYGIDSTKLTINVCKTGISAYETSKILNKEYEVQMESADFVNMLAIVTIGNTKKDIKRLISGLTNVEKKCSISSQNMTKNIVWPNFSAQIAMNPRDAAFSMTKKVPFKDAIGAVSAEVVSPYPPGIPILVPGERITREIYDYLYELNNVGARINGQDDKKMQTIKVVWKEGVQPLLN
ncbi:MAG: aminotransferase class I/II-fold pyridoxal phosphate-dependent enzyme [Candidatus Firestonebacteria bacterium]